MSASVSNSGFSVLQIEDSEIDHELLKRAFDKSGHEIELHWRNSSDLAFEYLTECRGRLPSMILLDLNLPGEDGKSVLSRLKRAPELRTIPVIVLSSSSDPTEVERCFWLGANAFIQKPLKPFELETKIKSLLNFWVTTAVLPLPERNK